LFLTGSFFTFIYPNPKRFSMRNESIVLTPKERQVMQLLAKGFTYKEISAPMKVSPETVKKHLKNIYRKLKVQNKVEALGKVKLL
jgi:DNA-binding CsgD family transcriptional regulator